MKKILFLLLGMLLGCSENETPLYVSLETDSIEVSYKEDKILKVDSNDEFFQVDVEDRYFIDASRQSPDEILISGLKVGETKIVVSSGYASDVCVVKVKPVDDLIGTPIVALGKASAYITQHEDAELINLYPNLMYYDDVPFGASHVYYLESDLVSHIITTIGISRLNSNFNLYGISLSNSLRERYEYVKTQDETYRNIIYFKYKNEFYIGLTKGLGNGDWYICYAKTMEDVKKHLDKHPSSGI